MSEWQRDNCVDAEISAQGASMTSEGHTVSKT